VPVLRPPQGMGFPTRASLNGRFETVIQNILK